MYYNRKSNMPDGRKGVPMKLVIPEYKTLELDTIFLSHFQSSSEFMY